MDQQLNFEVISQKEQAFDNVQTLNKSIDKNKNLLLCVNIRSIKQNLLFWNIKAFDITIKEIPASTIST